MADKVLFISGYSNTGKTTTTTEIIKLLSNNGYRKVSSQPTGQQNIDEICLFEGLDKTGNNIKIVINTAADNVASVNNFDSFLSQNPCDIIITARQNLENIRQRISDTVQKYLSEMITFNSFTINNNSNVYPTEHITVTVETTNFH